jgi:flavin-dependent dehydrogenase
MWDVVVVGAGPAGSIAAYVLVKGGCSVLLVDADKGSSNAIGETFPVAGLRILRTLGIKAPSEEGTHQIVGGTLSCWGSDSLTPRDFFRDPEGPPWRVDRRLFDSSLRDSVQEAGAVVIRSKAKQVERAGSQWNLRLSNGTEVSSHWLIDAGGRKSGLSRQLGVNRNKDVSLIALYRLSNPLPSPDSNRAVIEAVADGWWYAAPLPNGRIVAGFHTSPATARHLFSRPEAWQALWRQSNHVALFHGSLTFEERLAPLDASGALSDKCYGTGWISCGDAALSFDPLSSQGLLTALYTGMTAGKCTLEALDGNLITCDRYAEQLLAIRQSYRANLLRTYRDELRWRKRHFWRVHQETCSEKDILRSPLGGSPNELSPSGKSQFK